MRQFNVWFFTPKNSGQSVEYGNRISNTNAKIPAALIPWYNSEVTTYSSQWNQSQNKSHKFAKNPNYQYKNVDSYI